MQLQGMDDQTYLKILSEVNDIRYLIVRDGQMATKTKIEQVLVTRYGLSASDAHTFTNMAENANIRDFRIGHKGYETQWTAKRPEPKKEDWPELIVK